MDDDTRYKIAVLAEDAHAKRQRFMAMGMANTYGKSADEAAKQRIAYEIARAEWMEAEGLLWSAQR